MRGASLIHPSILHVLCSLLLRPGGLATGSMELKLGLQSSHVLFSASMTVVLHLLLLARFDEDPAVIYHTYARWTSTMYRGSRPALSCAWLCSDVMCRFCFMG